MNSTFKLDQSQIDKFNDDGFLILDESIDSSLIDQALEDMQTLHLKKPKIDYYQKGQRVQDAWKYSKALYALTTEKTCFNVSKVSMAAKHSPFKP